LDEDEENSLEKDKQFDKFIEEQEDSEKATFLLQVKNFRQKGISIFSLLNESNLSSFLMYANLLYFNDMPILTDNEYDIVKEYMEKRFPSLNIGKEVGAPIPSIYRNKVVLPHEMASMNKIKPDSNALQVWKTRFQGDYILSCKLDGVSGMYCFNGSNETQGKLYTRGDGKVGLDISHFLSYMNLPKHKNMVLRGEFIIKKKVFLEKYKKDFANPRNLVSGILLQKKIDPKFLDIDFVIYEVIEPILSPLDQMNFLKTFSISNIVSHQLVSSSLLSNELLSTYLKEWRNSSIYDIDGIIVTNNHLYPRKSGNPEHAFAFKMILSDQIAEAKVVDVIWTPSKDGYLKPRVQFEPLFLGGVKIEFATGFNAAFIESNKIGVGAIIELIRSGDVIPYIKSIKVPAVQVKMPLEPYEWNETKMDIILKNIEDNITVREKNITSFFQGLEVEGLSSGNIARIYKAGFQSVPAIINMKMEDYLNIDGFQLKMAKKVYEGIQNKLKNVSLITFMAASNIFGRGFSDKKLELILKSFPDILISPISIQEKIHLIKNIKGMAEKTAEAFITKIPDFLEFGNACGRNDFIYANISLEKVDLSNPLFDKNIIITGFRDSNFVDLLIKKGAKLGTTVNKNTFIIIVKDDDFLLDKTSKIIDAEKLGKPILSLNKFKEKYLIN